MKTLVTCLLLGTLLLFAPGCSETPQATDSTTEPATDLGEASGDPEAPGEQTEPGPATPEGEAGSELESEGGPELPAEPTP